MKPKKKPLIASIPRLTAALKRRGVTRADIDTIIRQSLSDGVKQKRLSRWLIQITLENHPTLVSEVCKIIAEACGVKAEG